MFYCQRASTNVQRVSSDIDSSATQDLFVSSITVNNRTGMARQFVPQLNSSLTWDALRPD